MAGGAFRNPRRTDRAAPANSGGYSPSSPTVCPAAIDQDAGVIGRCQVSNRPRSGPSKVYGKSRTGIVGRTLRLPRVAGRRSARPTIHHRAQRCTGAPRGRGQLRARVATLAIDGHYRTSPLVRIRAGNLGIIA